MKSDESIFLTEIEAAPRSVDRRLIYADWLEEQGDPRGELIQIWHEQDSLKPWTIEYADRASRIRQLQDEIDADWLTQLGYSAKYRPMLAEIPRDRASRWRLLTTFLEIWHRPITDSDRVPELIARAPEKLVGERLPSAFVEWYMHFGNADDVWRYGAGSVWNSLTPPSELLPYPERDQLEIWPSAGGRGDGYYLRLSELSMDDPPVYDGRVGRIGLSVSEFAIFRALVTTIACSVKTPGWSARPLSGPSRYVPSYFSAAAMSEVTTIAPATFFEAPDALVRVDTEAISMTAVCEDAVQDVLENLPEEHISVRVDGVTHYKPFARRFVEGVSDPSLLEG